MKIFIYTIPKLYGKNPECFVSLLGRRSRGRGRGRSHLLLAPRTVDTGLVHAYSAAVLPIVVTGIGVYLVGAIGGLTLGHVYSMY